MPCRPLRLLSFILVVLLLAASVAQARPDRTPRAPARRLMDLAPAEVEALLGRAAALPSIERLNALSAAFLGTPYAKDPLGEGTGEDADPLFRLDAVDCLTFVETLWALGGAATPAQARERLTAIRYDGGKPDYARRRHFVWLDWLPANLREGRLRDVTRIVAGAAALKQTKTLDDPAACRGRLAGLCRRLAGRFPFGPATHDVLPLAWAIRHVGRLPPGAFLFVVLKDRPSLPYRIHHAGLIVEGRGGTRRFRHASTVRGKVVEVSLKGYLEMLDAKSLRWPVEGIILAEPLF